MAALNQKHDDLEAERKLVRRSGDRAAADRIRDELKKVSAEQNKLNEEIIQAYSARVQSGEMAKEMAAGVPEQDGARLTFFVNADRAWVPQTAVPVDVAGAQRAFWRPSDGGSLVVLLGIWEPTSPTFRATLAKAAVISKPQTVLIEIRAGRQAAEKLARELKLNAILAELK